MNVNVDTLTESIAFVESIIIRLGQRARERKNVNCIINAVCLYENCIIVNTRQNDSYSLSF